MATAPASAGSSSLPAAANDGQRLLSNRLLHELIKTQATATPTRFWANQCVYECGVCRDNFTAFNALNYHAQRAHGCRLKDLQSLGGWRRIVTKYLKCLVCLEEVVCDQLTLEGHLAGHDSLSLNKYADMLTQLVGVMTGEIKPTYTSVPPKGPAPSKSYILCSSTSPKKRPPAAAATDLTSDKGPSMQPSDPIITYSNKGQKKRPSEATTPHSAEIQSKIPKCMYRCTDCPREFATPLQLKVHASFHSKRLKRTYNRAAAKYFQCQRCLMVTYFHPKFIQSHLNLVHCGMKLSAYKKEAKDEYRPLEEADVKDQLSHVTETLSERVSQIAARDWADMCRYECQICLETFTSVGQLRRHAIRTHKLAGANRQRANCKLVKQVFLTCQLCRKKIPHDRLSIRIHLNRRHGRLKLSEYLSTFFHTLDFQFDLVVNQARCCRTRRVPDWTKQGEYECGICSFSEASGREMKSHMMLAHGERSAKKVIGFKLAHHRCQMCCETLLWYRESIAAHAVQKHGLSGREYFTRCADPMENASRAPSLNRCAFECDACGFLFLSYRQLRVHLYKMHRVSYKDSGKGRGYKENAKSRHDCVLCKKNLLHDEFHIRRHLFARHQGLSLSAYAERCTRKRAKACPPNSWQRQCEFQCGICLEKLPLYNRLQRHAKVVHGGKELSYLVARLTRATLHKCLVCGRNVFCDPTYLRNHYKNNVGHDSLEGYQARFAEKLQQPEHFFPASADEMSKVLRRGPMSWYNKCQYQCSQCRVVFHSHDTFGQHWQMAHQDVIAEEMGRRIVSASHECLLCQKSYPCDEKYVRTHLALEHDKMTIAEYTKSLAKRSGLARLKN